MMMRQAILDSPLKQNKQRTNLFSVFRFSATEAKPSELFISRQNIPFLKTP
jgi:hypothetical protein